MVTRAHGQIDERPDSPDAQRADYRARLQRLTEARAAALVDVERSTEEIADLLPLALGAGISMVELADLTGVSRATLYRTLAEGRRHQDVHELAAFHENLLTGLSDDLGRDALPADIAARLKCSTAQVFERLMQIYPILRGEFMALGPVAMTKLSGALGGLHTPEDTILRMLLLQDLSIKRVAWSTQLSEIDVVGWASLGLLRVLPGIRASRPEPS